MRYLTIPGLSSSGPNHWQTLWEQASDDCSRVELSDYDDPKPLTWSAELGRAVAVEQEPVVLVAHSLGCIAVASWASWARFAGERAHKVSGALLVAPADVERDGADERVRRFAPIPLVPLPFPTIVVASRNDPCASFQRSREMGVAWAARFHDAGPIGHINAASQLGAWPAGQALVAELIQDASAWYNRIGRSRLPRADVRR